MTNTSKPIVFFGTEDFSAQFLTALIDAGYDIRAVVTKPDSKKGRGQQLAEPLVKTIATAHDIEVWQPQKLSEIVTPLSSLGSVAGVLVSYGKIIPQSIINVFSPGIINVHPSLLPRYRGPSPIESAITNGDSETGVSIMQLSKAMDAGPVYSQVAYPLNGTETQSELYQTLASVGTNLLLEVLPRILTSDLQPTPQDDTQASYCKLLVKTDGQLNPQTLNTIEAEQRVRAYLKFPRVKLNVLKKDIIVTKAHISHTKTTELDIKFKDGHYLSIDELVAPSGKTINSEDFLKGYQK